MKAIKAVRASISEDLPPLHLLFTEEDDVIVVRCLDFSISSHGDTIEDAIESMNDVLIEYVKYYVENECVEDIFDRDLEEYWDLYYKLEAQMDREKFAKNLSKLKEILSRGQLIHA